MTLFKGSVHLNNTKTYFLIFSHVFSRADSFGFIFPLRHPPLRFPFSQHVLQKTIPELLIMIHIHGHGPWDQYDLSQLKTESQLKGLQVAF